MAKLARLAVALKTEDFHGCQATQYRRKNHRFALIHGARLLCALLFCSAHQLSATSIALNFDGFQDSTILTTQYPGVTFTNAIILSSGISLNEFEFPPHSGVNVVSDNGGPMSIDFASPVTSFSGYFTYSEPLTIQAFSAVNSLVASATSAFSDNMALSGDPGSSPNELLDVSFGGGIASVTITGDPNGGSFVLDDATLTESNGSSATPEPHTTSLAVLGLTVVLFLSLRALKRRRHLLGVIAIILYTQAFNLNAATSLGSIFSLPASITPNKSYTLTVFITIQDSTVIPAGVNLLQISSPSQATVIGQLHDDGQNGDLIARDSVYTIQVPVNEPQTGQIQLQVSAAVKGQLRRVLSTVLTIPVTSDAGLPPEPGAPGLVTLGGIDSDGDGVRDDLQRYIALTYPNSAKTRGALTDMAKALQSMVLATSAPDSITSVTAFSHAFECSLSISNASTATALADKLRAQALNTIARSQAYLTADGQFSGQFYKLAPTLTAQKALCSFNPDLLPN